MLDQWLFTKPDAYITHNTAEPLSDITGDYLADHMQLLLDPQQTSHRCFSHTPQDLYCNTL